MGAGPGREEGGPVWDMPHGRRSLGWEAGSGNGPAAAHVGGQRVGALSALNRGGQVVEK
jgi:hypothetical protein